MTKKADKYDVAVVGAGPAGTSAAIRLATAGFSVVLVEQKRFPREKLCGEFISPECLPHFDELGVLPAISMSGGASYAETIFFARNGKGVAVESSWFGSAATVAIGLSRSAMDLTLLERARDAGVEVLEDTAAAGLILDGGRVAGIKLKRKNEDGSSVAAKLTIDATGRSRSLARRLETLSEPKRPARFVAFKSHLRGASVEPGACEIYAYHGGYGGCNEVEKGLYNCCFIVSAVDTKRLGSDPERVWHEVVLTNRRAAETMEDAVAVDPWLAVPIERFGRGTLVPAEGLITVGDAAAFIDPFTGSGILLALESAKIAAKAVIDGFAKGSNFSAISAAYQQNYASAFNKRLRVCSVLRYAAFVPLLAEVTIGILGMSTGLRRRLALATRSSAGEAV